MKKQKIDWSGITNHLTKKSYEQMAKGLPSDLFPMYNAFVEAANKANLLFKNLEIQIGETAEGEQGLSFVMETDTGLSDNEAKRIFQDFINEYPTASINFNMREEPTAFEKMLYDVSDTVLEVHEGFKLKPI